ncbi:MAG: hypothetical protein ACYC6N_16905 [Pirellulaceae bacterium]
MRLTSFLLVSFAVMLGVSRISADDEPTGPDYVNFFKQLTGTWIGKAVTGSETHDRKWIIELSPTGTCFTTYETEDGKPFYHSLDGYDPTTKKYTPVGFYSDGVREVLSLELDRKTLRGAVEGVTYEGHTEGLDADGKPTSCDYTSTIVTRNKWVIKATNIVKDGKTQPDITITYTRQ